MQSIGYSIYYLSMKSTLNSESQHILGPFSNIKNQWISTKEERIISSKEETSITSAVYSIHILRGKILDTKKRVTNQNQ